MALKIGEENNTMKQHEVARSQAVPIMQPELTQKMHSAFYLILAPK